MPLRKHWVYKIRPNCIVFDKAAIRHFKLSIQQKAELILNASAYVRTVQEMRTARMPRLFELAEDLGVRTPKLFRLPKHLRRNKNPIFVGHKWLS